MKHWITLLLILLLAACGGNDADNANDANVTSSNAESSTTEDQQPTPFPTFAFTQPTEAPQVMTAAARSATETTEADAGGLDPVAVERGLGRYEALACASCHGEGGVGGEEEGTSLIGYAAAEDVFIDFMRTGGDMGNDHRFPTEILSNSGIRNLYQYLLSLGESE